VLERSAFFFSCLCGHEFQTEHKGTFQCPDCGRLLVIEWRPENDLTQRAMTLSPSPELQLIVRAGKHTNEKVIK
jgi:DNA-directed RNA polymerase subunit RPC12/RpoP